MTHQKPEANPDFNGGPDIATLLGAAIAEAMAKITTIDAQDTGNGYTARLDSAEAYELELHADAGERLANQFDHGVARLSLTDIAVAMPNRKLPRSLPRFSLVPVKSANVYERSLSPSGYSVIVPEGIKTTYRNEYGGLPYLDTQYGIGLAKDDWLVAIAGAGIDANNKLKIVQLQDVSGTSSKKNVGHEHDPSFDPKTRFKTGLHDGFDWRGTLVEAWATLAKQELISDAIIVQSGSHNQWQDVRTSAISRFLPIHPGYDGVAARRGFYPTPNGDWIREVA